VATVFSVVGAVFNVALCLVLIPRYGITGAGAVILCQSLVFLPVFLWFSTRRVLRIGLGSLITRSLLRPAAATALAASLMVAVLPLVHGWAMLVLAGVASAVWYALVARVVGAYDIVDTGAARRSLARPAAVADTP
jgi:O-antigen/teichoic acid export membrane protein